MDLFKRTHMNGDSHFCLQSLKYSVLNFCLFTWCGLVVLKGIVLFRTNVADKRGHSIIMQSLKSSFISVLTPRHAHVGWINLWFTTYLKENNLSFFLFLFLSFLLSLSLFPSLFSFPPSFIFFFLSLFFFVENLSL